MGPCLYHEFTGHPCGGLYNHTKEGAMSNNTIICANTQCRVLIKEEDPRVKIDRFTYCGMCGKKKQDG